MKKFHWFWAWEDEKEEVWLREMSQQGWHFKSVSAPGFYTFEKGDAADYVYRLDYFIDRKDMPSYLQIFEDAGWDYMGEMAGWQYFRIESLDGSAPEIYSDKASKAKKYERLILFLVIFLPIYLNMMNIVSRGSAGYLRFFSPLMGAFMLLYIYAMVRLVYRVTILKKKV
ncbi:MAG: DUF2812 domain-containing protein [Chloroflexi bacterium]|nr:DUF2812 domain-containing protein [Chloroflexota bacterium]